MPYRHPNGYCNLLISLMDPMSSWLLRGRPWTERIRPLLISAPGGSRFFRSRTRPTTNLCRFRPLCAKSPISAMNKTEADLEHRPPLLQNLAVKKADF
jgi:hypothetical protein